MIADARLRHFYHSRDSSTSAQMSQSVVKSLSHVAVSHKTSFTGLVDKVPCAQNGARSTPRPAPQCDSLAARQHPNVFRVSSGQVPSALPLLTLFPFCPHPQHNFPASEGKVEPRSAQILVCKGKRWFSIGLFPWCCVRRVTMWPDLRRCQAAISFASPALEPLCILHVILSDSVLKADKILIPCMPLLSIFCKNQECASVLSCLETPSTGDASGAQWRLDISSREQEWVPLAGYGPRGVSEAQETHACWNKQMGD